MEEIYIKPTDVSPEVIFQPAKKTYSITGISRPQSPSQFYAPVLKWLDDYGNKYLGGATICFDLEYFNTPSARSLRNIFSKIEELHASGVKVNLIWVLHHESEQEEFEYEFAHALTVPITFQVKKS